MEAAAEIPEEELREHRGLVAVFKTQGFNDLQSELLAAALVEPEQTQRLRSMGASYDQAFRILI